MTVQCLTAENKKQYNICQGLACFVEHIAGKAQQWGNTFATAIRKTDIADEVGKDTRTITRYLNQLEKMGLVEIEAKRGRNGGTVIVFNTDVLNFEPTDNPLTSESKEAYEIRAKLFPKAKKKEPKRRYRTKAQIAEDRALRMMKQSRDSELNDIVTSLPNVTRDFFDNFGNPRLYYQGYLIAQMYNAYVAIFPKNRYELYKDSDTKKAEQGLKYMHKAYGYNVLSERFVGTPAYARFVEIAEYCNEHNINPLSYLTVQFEHTEYLADIGIARRSAVPFVNSLLSDDSKDRYKDKSMFYRRMRNSYGFYKISQSKVPYIGAKYPLISSLLFSYQEDRTGQDSLDFLIDELEQTASNSVKQSALLSYYATTQKALDESTLEQASKDKISQFMKEQVALYSRKNSMNVCQYALAFPLQVYAVKNGVALNSYTEEEYFTYIGNMYKSTMPTKEEFEQYTKVGERIDFSYHGNYTFMQTMFMLADCRSLGVAPNEISLAIKEFGVEKIPLDKFGMLDVKRVYQKFTTQEEVDAENRKEFSQAQAMSNIMNET